MFNMKTLSLVKTEYVFGVCILKNRVTVFILC